MKWILSQEGKNHCPQVYAYMGGDVELATLTKRAKHWEAYIWLPQCQVRKQYGPLEVQRAAVEKAVEGWFAEATR